MHHNVDLMLTLGNGIAKYHYQSITKKKLKLIAKRSVSTKMGVVEQW